MRPADDAPDNVEYASSVVALRDASLEFSPDGSRLLTGGADGTLRLWDAASRQPIGSTLEVEPDAYVSAGFASGGSRVIAVPHFGRAVSWDVRPAAWERHACLVAGRELTAREWRDALPEHAQRLLSLCPSPAARHMTFLYHT